MLQFPLVLPSPSLLELIIIAYATDFFSSFCLAQLRILSLAGEPVPAAALQPVVQSLHACWQRRVSSSSSQESSPESECSWEDTESEGLPAPEWAIGRSCAVFGGLAVPSHADAYRLVFRADGRWRGGE